MLRSLLAFIACCLCVHALAGERAIIVLDASGSMWGQLQGKSKIELARETLDSVLTSSPDDLSLGLIAYGHRRKGDCADIELLVQPETGGGAAIAAAANRLSPKGKTPLSDAVVQAAETLKFTEDKATVILITDGLETCDRDPCAVGTTLAQAGLDFTAHVVGFGLSAEEGKQVACLAENTGGMYLAADDADQLGEALAQTVAVVFEPEPETTPELEESPVPTASLEAEATVQQAAMFTVGWEGPGDRYDAVQIFDPRARGGEGKVVRSANLLHGNVESRQVTMAAPAKLGGFQLRYWDGRNRRVLAIKPFEVIETSVSLAAPEEVEAGRDILVEWQGPGGRYDRLELFDPSAMNGDGKVLRGKYLRHDDFDDRRARLPAPAKPGRYELRYWNGENKTVLVRRPILVLEADVALQVSESPTTGRNISVEWTGPGGRYDAVQLFDPSALGGEGKVLREKRLRNDDFDNRRVAMPAPAKPGVYELRYWNGDNKAVLTTLTIEIAETAVALDAPESVELAHTIEIAWSGPGGRYDAVQLYDPSARGGDGKVLRDKRLRNDDFDNRRVNLSAPAKPGEYELRYWNGDNKAVLATRPIEVIPTDVVLSAPDKVAAGEIFVVEWVGPGARYDDVQIFDANGKTVAGRRLRNAQFDDRKVSIKAPKQSGRYELRYWNGENKTVLSTRPLIVE